MMNDRELLAQLGRTAHHELLLPGSLTSTAGKVVSSCSLVLDADRLIVIDPGMATSQEDILGPLRARGHLPEQVTDVVLSHHHPDHTLNAALFPRAAVHDHWAIYRGADWQSVDAEGRQITPSVRLIRTPGHTAEDITTLVGTAEGIIACTHLWCTASWPDDDPVATDQAAFHRSRARVLALAEMIVPGHGPAFRPGPSTPR